MIQLDFEMSFTSGGGLTAAADGFLISPEGEVLALSSDFEAPRLLASLDAGQFISASSRNLAGGGNAPLAASLSAFRSRRKNGKVGIFAADFGSQFRIASARRDQQLFVLDVDEHGPLLLAAPQVFAARTLETISRFEAAGWTDAPRGMIVTGDDSKRAELLYGLYVDYLGLNPVSTDFAAVLIPRYSSRPSGLATGLVARVA